MPNRTATGELPQRRTEGLQPRYGVVLEVPSIDSEDVHTQEHVELTTIQLTSGTGGRLRLSHIVYIAN